VKRAACQPVKEDRVSTQPIAVFDSGLGGLSVVRHLRQQLPAEDIVYFGDTARVPYGTKSPRTVTQFSLECARYLLQFDPKILIAACNTASALALDALRAALPIEVLGVVEPGARAACAAAEGGRVAVLGTEATIASGAYERALRAIDPSLQIDAIACPLFVPIVEEGRSQFDPVVVAAVAGYLAPLRENPPRAVVLGCTHYPLLSAAIDAYLGPRVTIVDSGRETASDVRRILTQHGLLAPADRVGRLRGFVSDNASRFRAVSTRFLQETVDDVALVEAEEYAGQSVDRV
jgi:glutamate racemase